MSGRAGGDSGRGGRRSGSSHVDTFYDESDSAISQRSSRAGLGSATRQQHQQQSGGQFNRHTQHLSAQGGRVPKFLVDIVAASSQSVRRQLPASLVEGLARTDADDDDRADAGDEKAKLRRDSRIAREMELRKEEEGNDRPIREDELPAIANLTDYAHQSAELTELLGRAPPQQQAALAEGKEKVEGAEAESDLPAGRQQRSEDARADEMERATGQHVFRKSKARAATSAEQSTQPASKKSRTASKLSFDEEDV